jgi:hypothetical protein
MQALEVFHQRMRRGNFVEFTSKFSPKSAFIHKKSCVSADITAFHQTLKIPVADETSCEEGALEFHRENKGSD